MNILLILLNMMATASAENSINLQSYTETSNKNLSTNLITDEKRKALGNVLSETKLIANDAEDHDSFGNSVSIFGDRALVGAPNDDNGTNIGSAYIFEYDGIDWIQTSKIVTLDGTANHKFGYSVSLFNDRALIGAYGDQNNGVISGSAYVFEFNGINWVQVLKLTPDDQEAFIRFGISVYLSENMALIGADRDISNGFRSGSAYVFNFDGSTWVETQKLAASNAEENDYFGTSVSLSGNRALLGAPGDTGFNSSIGSAYIFEFDGNNWIEIQELTASDGSAGDQFGKSVSISGSRLLIGAQFNWNSNGGAAGAAYIFEQQGSNWNETMKLIASDGEPSDVFGNSVSIFGNRALIGAFGVDNFSGDLAGSAYLFEFDGSGWSEVQKLTADGGRALEWFGWSVNLWGNRAIIGAFQADITGAAYIYEFESIQGNGSPVQVPINNAWFVLMLIILIAIIALKNQTYRKWPENFSS